MIGTIDGVQQEHGGYDESYDYTSNYDLVPVLNIWWLASGSGGASSSGSEHWSYSGSGTYSRTAGNVSGTVQENGEDHYTYDYTTTGEVDAEGQWVDNGSGSELASGNSHYGYSGSGTQITVNGTRTTTVETEENYSEEEEYLDQASYTLTDNVWTGSATDTSSYDETWFHSVTTGVGDSSSWNSGSYSGNQSFESTLTETRDYAWHESFEANYEYGEFPLPVPAPAADPARVRVPGQVPASRARSWGGDWWTRTSRPAAATTGR
jgi:hypothetical protein